MFSRRAVSALVVPALMIVPASPPTHASAPVASTSQQTATPVAPAPLTSLTQTLQLFQGLADSTANQSAQSASLAVGMPDIFGWEMAAIGIAGSAQSTAETVAQLSEIDDQITGIQNTITSIGAQITGLQSQLKALSAQLQNQDCGVETAQMTLTLGYIQDLERKFSGFATQASQAADGAAGVAPPTWGQIVGWANTAVSGTYSVPVMLNTLNNVLVGTTDDGSISACAAAAVPLAGTTPFGWEQAYYSQVYNYMAYWYQIQVIALNLYVQAMHVLAVEASGDPTDFPVGDPSGVCQPPLAKGDVVTACNLAADEVSDLTDAITAQFSIAGAPYSWGTAGQVFAANPFAAGNPVPIQPYAWLMDINDFQTAGCTLPVSSASSPCGGSVGTSGQFANPTWGDFVWGAYTGWVPAKTLPWQSIGLQPPQTTNAPIWQRMQQLGFGDPTWGAEGGLDNLIVYTGEVVTSDADLENAYPGSASVTGQCFFDTANNISDGPPVASGVSSWNVPACDGVGWWGGALISYLSSYFQPGHYGEWPNGSAFPYAQRSAPIQYSNPAFYNADFELASSPNPWIPRTAPGWATASPGATFTPTPEFRWPVLPLNDAMCSAKIPGNGTMDATNSGGAYTMCGADMTAWIAAQLPQMPTPAAPISVSASPTLGAAAVSWLPGSVRQKPVSYRIRGKRGDGKWRTLVRDTSAKSRELASTSKRLRYPVPVAKSGFWRFKVVALMKDRRSRPSAPTRREYITTKRVSARYYVFTQGQKRRVVKSFADGRVYWVGREQSAFGTRHKRVLHGHTFRDPYRWSGTWHQRADGSWKAMQWPGWVRVDGPARTRKGMPKAASRLPRY